MNLHHRSLVSSREPGPSFSNELSPGFAGKALITEERRLCTKEGAGAALYEKWMLLATGFLIILSHSHYIS